MNMELYAHVSRADDKQWELSIGREVPGNPSHGAANRIGEFTTALDAVRYAIGRGVYPSRITVDIPEICTVR